MSEAFKQVGKIPYYWRQEGDAVANVYLDHAGLNWHIKIIKSCVGEVANEVVVDGTKDQAQQVALDWFKRHQKSGEIR